MLSLNAFFQNAYVCRDIEKAMAWLKKEHGLGEFVRFDPDMDVDTTFGGRGNVKLKVALAWAGSMQIELIEPVSGLMNHYADFLPKDDSLRLHHLGMRVDDWDKARAEIAKMRWPITYEGAVPGANFVYLDARDTFGHYLEYLWMSPELWAATDKPKA